MTDIINHDEFLDYPRKFFNVKSGSGPKDKDDAVKWWPSRAKRPKQGTMIDDVEPNGDAMLAEVLDLRSKLRIFVSTEYFQMIRQRAKLFGLVNESTGENAILTKDLKRALSTLQNTPENHKLVYHVFYEFHKDRDWSAETIDKWLLSKRMKLQPKENNGDRDYIMSRGGFTAVARHAKSNIIAVFKDNLLKAQGWCIASSLPSTRATKNLKNFIQY